MPATLPILAKTFQKLIRLHARKSRPNLERFGRDAREVMSTRIWLAMTGKLKAVEASRMVLEKQVAVLCAQLACARSLLSGKPAAASRECFDIYQRAVHSNRKRLRRHRRA
jgi:hypothetical protein